MVPVGSDLAGARERIATACRILAIEGLVENVLGHISVRASVDRMLIRCRGPQDKGLLFTEAADIRLVDFDGNGDDLGEYTTPNELPIHGEVYKAREEARAVVHAHPPSVLVAGITDLPLEPVFGAYNIPAMSMALEGVPVYPRSVLIRRPELAQEMIGCMGDRAVCVLRGHGITTVGENLEQAVVRAINLHALAVVAVSVASTGQRVEPISEADIAELPDLGGAFNDLSLYRFLEAKAGLHLVGKG